MAVVAGRSSVESAARAAPRHDERKSLWGFWSPRYWATWLFVGWLWLTAQLPWRVAIAVDGLLGSALWYVLKRRRRIVLRNLELCFGELAAAEIKRLARRHFACMGASLAEIAIAWFGTAPWSRPPVQFEGLEHLKAALDRGKGVILYTGHFTTLELTAQLIGAVVPRFAFMFRARSNALLDAIQERGRERTAHLSFGNRDSRAMLRALRDNAVVWYAPDQAYNGASSALLPFFGEPAMTSTATARLARLSGAAVVPLQVRRLDGSAGYRVRFEPAADEVPSGDAAADTLRLTSILERFVRACPEQYIWTHRRFGGRGSTLPDAYARINRDRAAGRTHRRDLFGPPLLIVAVSLFIVAADNDLFWTSAWRATQGDEHGAAILAALFALVFFTLTTTLALAVGAKMLRAAATLLLLVAANCGFFMSQYGVVIDESMIRNAVETTALEAAPLFSATYFWHLFLYGVLPIVVVWWVPLRSVSWTTDVAVRFGTAVLGMVLLSTTLYVNYAAAASFGREHDDLRMRINPLYPLYAAATFGMGSDDEMPRAREPLDVRLAPNAAEGKRALVVLVMGETARADRFSLNGYERDTNRYTSQRGIVNFPRVLACGTSTAESVPCIFSGLGRAHFSHGAALARESIVGAMERLGVSTFWRDNSTGCKSVCDEGHFEQRANWARRDLCDATGCFDEVLLEDFDSLLTDRSKDHFIVLHQRGSHGPAYHSDVPAWAKEYAPECDSPNLRNCSRASIDNAYDNTILYTDYFLSRVIDELERYDAEFDTAMLYVSDHGESLGENGLYLHGFPYAMAPRAQVEVPMLWWASAGFYRDRARVDRECLAGVAHRGTSHDALFHTLLPLLRLESPLYDASLDSFAPCRMAGWRGAGQAAGTPVKKRGS